MYDVSCLSRFFWCAKVAETAPEAIAEDKDSINGVQQLSVEATAINQNFSQQVLLQGGRKLQYDEPNPFVAEGSNEELAAVAYRCAWMCQEP